jgi:hypothetical protein
MRINRGIAERRQFIVTEDMRKIDRSLIDLTFDQEMPRRWFIQVIAVYV